MLVREPIEAPFSKLPGASILKVIIYSNRSLTPPQTAGIALAPGFTGMQGDLVSQKLMLLTYPCAGLL